METTETTLDPTQNLKDKAIQYITQCKTSMEQLQLDRTAALKAYNRGKYGNEIKGRSQVVMSDVADTIEWIMPSLMRIFYGGMDVVSLEPQGPEDEAKAKLMEEKINYDFQRGMNGFQILYDFFKDALLYKMGVTKYRWMKETRTEKRFFEGLNMMEVMALTNNPNFQIDKTEPVGEMQTNEFGQPIPESVTYNVQLTELKKISKPVIENIPPEEFLFLPYEKNISDSRFVAHKKKIRIAELRKYGISEVDVRAEIDAFGSDPLYTERFSDLGGLAFLTPDENQDEVWLYECYLNDYDAQGNKVPKIIKIVGYKTISVEDNTYGRPPFNVCSPIRMPHRLVGTSIAELVLELQKLHTSLVRYILDNIYFQNNGVQVVNPMRINMDDLMNNNIPGGKVRTLLDTEPNKAIYPVPISPLPPQALQFLEYVTEIKENRTGITKYNQGLDSKSLNRTASGINQIMSAAQQRVELIARIFAESEDGVKGMFQALVDMNLKFFDKAQNIKLDEGWQMLNPLDISGSYDLIIDIGSASGSKEIKVNQLMSMLDKYMAIAPNAPQLITLDNFYNLISSIWENMGFKNSNQFVTEPQPLGGMNVPGQMGGPNQTSGGSPVGMGIPPDPRLLQGFGPMPMGGVQAQPQR